MNTSIKNNVAYQMAYEILVLILPLVTSPYLSRVIGAEGVGVYSYSYTIANYFVLFAMLGIKNYGCRVIAQVRDDPKQLNETFSSLMATHVLVSLLCMAAYAGYVCLLKSERIYAAIQSAFVLSALFDISWFYFGIEKFKLTVIRSAVIKLLNVVCIFMFVRQRDDLWIYCLIMAVGILLSQLSLCVPLKKYVRFVRPDTRSMASHVKPLLILFVPAIAVSLYKYMDKIMIGAISGKEQLGYYENAEKVVNIALTVITAFGTAMLPRMSNLLQSEKRSIATKYIKESMQYVMCLAFAMAFGLPAIARNFAPVFWGKAFAYSGTLMIGLAIIIPFFSFANVIRTQYLIPAEKDRQYLISILAGAAINLVINTLLIPSYGALGATIGTIAAEILVCCVQVMCVRKELEVQRYLKNAVPFFLIGLIMFLPVHRMNRAGIPSLKILIVQIILGVTIYTAGSFLYLFFSKDPILAGILHRFSSNGKRHTKGRKSR